MIVNTTANYVELAAMLIPQPKSSMKEKLRSACGFIPMPLSLGWDAGDGSNETSPETVVPGLVLSDIPSGASRDVRAPWMHALYQHTSLHQPRGATLLRLDEVGFTSQFEWPHLVTAGTVMLQFVLALHTITYHQPREGWLILAGLLVQILQGVYDWIYPLWRTPRVVVKPRYYALHTRMTTTHILVIAHEPDSQDRKRYQLEDAAAPLIRLPSNGRSAWIERICKVMLWFAVWLQKAACIITPSQGFLYIFVLSLGTGVMSCLSTCTDALPRFSSPLDANPTKLETDASLLDIVTAVCQVTGSVSCGFVESILPDRKGEHTDYKWISGVLAFRAGEHPTHPSKETVLEYTLRRRNVQLGPRE